MWQGGGLLLSRRPGFGFQTFYPIPGRASSISVSAFTLFCIGRRYSALVHTPEGCGPLISFRAGRLHLASCTAYHFSISREKDELLPRCDRNDWWVWICCQFLCLQNLGKDCVSCFRIPQLSWSLRGFKVQILRARRNNTQWYTE